MSIEEIEELGYYDFMAYLEVPFFNIGGNPSLDVLVERCNIEPGSHVLDVGCGTGGNSVYIAKKYGCKVTGIDISELMVEKARERAIDENMEDMLSFQAGDAYALDFPDETFDTVLTVFVSQFLDLDRAFHEFKRVLKSGGYLGFNEMYRADNVPEELVGKVDEGEEVFRELTGLPFRLRTPSIWEGGLIEAGFSKVEVEAFTNYVDVSRGLDMVQEMGGWRKLLPTLWETLTLALRSGKIREKYSGISKGKRVLLNDRVTSKYIGYVLGVGKKI